MSKRRQRGHSCLVDRSAFIDICDYEATRSWYYPMERKINCLGDHALSQGRWIQFQKRWIRLRSMAGKEDKSQGLLAKSTGYYESVESKASAIVSSWPLACTRTESSGGLEKEMYRSRAVLFVPWNGQSVYCMFCPPALLDRKRYLFLPGPWSVNRLSLGRGEGLSSTPRFRCPRPPSSRLPAACTHTVPEVRNWPSDGRTPGIEIRCRRAGSDQDQRQILTASVLIRGSHPFEGRVRNLHCRGAWRVLCMWRDDHYTASHSSNPISSRRHEQKEMIFRVSPADRLGAERFKHQIQSPLLPCQNCDTCLSCCTDTRQTRAPLA
jgi:hypothetical protein